MIVDLYIYTSSIWDDDMLTDLYIYISLFSDTVSKAPQYISDYVMWCDDDMIAFFLVTELNNIQFDFDLII